MPVRSLNPLGQIVGSLASGTPSIPRDRGAGFEFPVWRAYTVADGDHLEVVLDRIRLIRGVHIAPTEHRCPLCQLPLRRIDGAHLFCTAGCDARAIPPQADGTGDFLPARRLPEDGIVERRFKVRGRFDPDPVAPIAACLRDARRVASERNTEEQPNSAHVSEMWERARGLQLPPPEPGWPERVGCHSSSTSRARTARRLPRTSRCGVRPPDIGTGSRLRAGRCMPCARPGSASPERASGGVTSR